MRNQFFLFLLSGLLLTTGCTVNPVPAQPTSDGSATCPDLMQVANAFYDANDASQINDSLAFLTDDVIMVFWAEGINGHHMDQKVVIGRDKMGDNLIQPGLHRKSGGPDLPNYTADHIFLAGNQLIFNLTPDRAHADGRPYNPYVVEMVFYECKIEIIKIVERVTWV